MLQDSQICTTKKISRTRLHQQSTKYKFKNSLKLKIGLFAFLHFLVTSGKRFF